jgi:hypothetical protein
MMGRRILVGVLIVAGAVGIGAAVAYVTRDDDSSDRAGGSTTTTTAATTIPSTTAASTTAPTTSPTTTEPPRAPLPDPCGAETATIRAAIDNGVDGARDGADIDTCRIAPVDTTWAAVNLVARAGADFTPLTVLLQGGGGSWAIVDQGQADVGCGQAPQQVLVDLGVLCSSTGGGGGV